MPDASRVTGADRGAGPGVVDSHVHVWSGNAVRFPFHPLDDLPVPDTARNHGHYRGDSSELSVDAVVLIQPRVYGYDHSYLFHVASTIRGRTRVMPLIDIRDDDGVRLLRKYAANGLTAGFRVIALGVQPAHWLLAANAHAIWSVAADLPLALGLLIDPEQLPLIGHIAERHPDLRIVIDHLARCTPTTWFRHATALRILAEQPNVFVKLSALGTLSRVLFPYTDMWPIIVDVYRTYGATRLLWGSDWPHTPPTYGVRQSRDAISQALSWVPDGELESIFTGTANRIFKLTT